jgi:integrase
LGKSTVEVQVDKIFKHTRQNSFGTRARYQDSARSFARYVHEKFKVQNIRNLSDKHVVAYIQQRQANGIAPKTIKNDLAAIRYMHDQVQNPRYKLSDNKVLKEEHGLVLEKTPQINGNRAWTNEEYLGMMAIAIQQGRQEIADVMELSRTIGLRITEAVAVSRAQVENALRTGVYQVKGEAKNGKHREVPLSKEARAIFEQRLANTPRGSRLFITQGEKTHMVVNRLEKFLEYHRGKVETTEGTIKRIYERNGEMKINELTYHGLRYMYVQDRMEQELENGLQEDQAAALVSKEVEHERIDVIEIYRGGK